MYNAASQPAASPKQPNEPKRANPNRPRSGGKGATIASGSPTAASRLVVAIAGLVAIAASTYPWIAVSNFTVAGTATEAGTSFDQGVISIAVGIGLILVALIGPFAYRFIVIAASGVLLVIAAMWYGAPRVEALRSVGADIEPGFWLATILPALAALGASFMRTRRPLRPLIDPSGKPEQDR